jgi:hypothetical protein
MEIITSTDTELLPPRPIRVETALSRYPVHRLAKRGDIAIDIREKNENGEVFTKWEVDYSKKHGQPGPIAYKLDTLIINRRIEEARRPIPRMLKLGSLSDICRELSLADSGKNRNGIKKSLVQNAFAGITTNTQYRLADGTERTLEAAFNRYSVILTGEELPDGRKADAVYIILNDIYIQVINGAMTRPLDYDYLKSLSPAPQRFYELLSYQMYAAIKNDRPRAKLVYSQFCTYAPQTRHFDWERVRSQMNKIYRPHKKSGYIVKTDYEQTVDSDGKPDWIMLYQPGPKARAEYRAFTKRGGPVMLEAEPFNSDPPPQLASPELTPLEEELIGRGITPVMATGLVREHSEEKVRAQLEHLDWLNEKKPGKVADPAAWLVSAIRNGHGAPKGFVSKADRDRQAEAKRQADRAAAAERRRTQAEDTRREDRRREEDAYWSKLTPAGQAELEARALAEAGAEAQQTYATLKRLKGGGKGYLADIRREHIRSLIDAGQSALP